MTTPNPAPAPVAPPIPAALQAHIAAEITKGVEAALASRPNPVVAPVTGKDLQLDLSEASKQKMLYAALGLRLKKEYLGRAKHFGLDKAEHFAKLGAFMERTKAAGQFVGVFEQGGVFAKETVSTELVALTRNNSILLSAGVRTVSGYGTQLTMGTVDEGVTVYWVGEGEAPTTSTMKTGRLVLQAHKLAALGKLSNDLLRLGTMDAAALLGEDMAAAIALEIDVVGLKGTGPKKPNGVRNQMLAAQRTATAGTSTANKITDTDKVLTDVAKANVPGGIKANSGFYYSSIDTFTALKQTRDNAGWVFPELRNSDNPTLNGRPFFTTETLSGDGVLGFGLASQLIMGEATPLEVAMGESGTDFSADMVTMRGITHVDFVLRYSKAFAEKTGVAY